MRRVAKAGRECNFAREIAVGKGAQPDIESACREQGVAPKDRTAGMDKVIRARKKLPSLRGPKRSSPVHWPYRRPITEEATGILIEQHDVPAKQTDIAVERQHLESQSQKAWQHPIIRRGKSNIMALCAFEPSLHRRDCSHVDGLTQHGDER